MLGVVARRGVPQDRLAVATRKSKFQRFSFPREKVGGGCRARASGAGTRGALASPTCARADTGVPFSEAKTLRRRPWKEAIERGAAVNEALRQPAGLRATAGLRHRASAAGGVQRGAGKALRSRRRGAFAYPRAIHHDGVTRAQEARRHSIGESLGGRSALVPLHRAFRKSVVDVLGARAGRKTGTALAWYVIPAVGPRDAATLPESSPSAIRRGRCLPAHSLRAHPIFGPATAPAHAPLHARRELQYLLSRRSESAAFAEGVLPGPVPAQSFRRHDRARAIAEIHVVETINVIPLYGEYLIRLCATASSPTDRTTPFSAGQAIHDLRTVDAILHSRTRPPSRSPVRRRGQIAKALPPLSVSDVRTLLLLKRYGLSLTV